MPRESYSITITFKSYFKLTTKYDYIDNRLWSDLADFISTKKNYKLVFSIEYHKYKPNHFKSGQDNPQAPHVHGILQVEEGLSQDELTNLHLYFNKDYGRTYIDLLPTEEDFDRWHEYIKKDIEKNNLQFKPYIHWREYTHTPTLKQLSRKARRHTISSRGRVVVYDSSDSE